MAGEIDDLLNGTLRGGNRRAVRMGLLGLVGLGIDLKIEGLEHVPSSGPVLVASNHLHNADPVLLAMAFPRPLYFMAKRELFANRALGGVLRFAGAFPVDRGKADRQAIRNAETFLAHGEAVAMFPEGTRSVSRKLGAGQPGAGLILIRSKAPLLPVAITGTEWLPGNGSKQTNEKPRGLRRTVRIHFGQMVPNEAFTTSGAGASQAAADQIMQEIAQLLPAEYLA